MANHLYGSNWTVERIEQLRKLWKDGFSASQIGNILGVTRNAVLGKAHRTKMPPKGTPVMPHRAPKRQRQKLPKPQRAPPRKVSGQAPALPFAGFLNTEFGELDLFSSGSPNQCRFPEGDSVPFLYCGTETLPGQPYCTHHRELCWMSRAKRNRSGKGTAARKQSVRVLTFEAA